MLHNMEHCTRCKMHIVSRVKKGKGHPVIFMKSIDKFDVLWTMHHDIFA